MFLFVRCAAKSPNLGALFGIPSIEATRAMIFMMWLLWRAAAAGVAPSTALGANSPGMVLRGRIYPGILAVTIPIFWIE